MVGADSGHGMIPLGSKAMIDETKTYEPTWPSRRPRSSSNSPPPAAITNPDTSMTASHSVPPRAARIDSVLVRSPTMRPTPGGRLDAVFPRLSTLASWPSRTRRSTMRRPTNVLPPRMRIFMSPNSIGHFVS